MSCVYNIAFATTELPKSLPKLQDLYIQSLFRNSIINRPQKIGKYLAAETINYSNKINTILPFVC